VKSTLHPLVFWGSSAIIALLLGIGVIIPEGAEQLFGVVQGWISDSLGWFYILAVAGFLFTVTFLALSRYGTIKLGPDDAEPDYNYLSWIAMLFAAGMGIGLMFFAVAEPIQHFSAPPGAEPMSLEAARQAQVITFFHWGVHAWGVYAIVGLSLAYFSFRYNLPLTIRSGLYPLLGNRINGRIGDLVDIFAIVSTIFGIATSLGLGVLQIDAGLGYLFGAPQEVWFQLILIAGITALATISVVTGLDVGIRRLSELNLVLALCLLLFVLFTGPTGFLLQAFAQNIGNYLDNFFVRTFNLYAYEPRNWIGGWTLFYWAWWIAWSPFVGMFIARISRGRTVREFALGVLLVPATLTFLWMTVFGNTAIWLDMGEAAGAISAAVATDVPVALFQFLEYLPFSGITSMLAVLLVAVFFITSSDSGSLVVDTIAAGGATDAPVWQRIYWCVLEGVAAAALLLAGGLGALQTMTLVAALPFTVIMIFLAFGLVRGLRSDFARAHARQRHAARPAVDVPWRQRLAAVLHPLTAKEVRTFIKAEVAPALAEVAAEMQRRGQDAAITTDEEEGSAVLTVSGAEMRDFIYGVRPARAHAPAFSTADLVDSERRRPRAWIAQTYFSGGRIGYDIHGFPRDQVINDALNQFEQYLALLHTKETSLYVGAPDPASS
jgi:choline/glycine/proline betaine transport protein